MLPDPDELRPGGGGDGLRGAISRRGGADPGRGALPGVLRSGARGGRLPAGPVLSAPGGRAAAGHRLVLQRLSRHGRAPAGARGGLRRGPEHGCWRRRHAQHLRHDAPPRPARARARLAARQAGGAGVHLGLRRQRGGALDHRPPAARLRDLLRCPEPRLDDRRHPPFGLREADLPAQRHGAPRRAARGDAGRGAEADRVRVGLFDGRRFRADRPDLRARRALRRADLSGRGPCRGPLRGAGRRPRRAAQA